MWDVPDTFHAASYRAVSWVEVWRGSEQIGVGPFKDGSVTDTWVTSGPRRTLSLTVAPSRDWLDWLRVGVELRPFRGRRFPTGDVVCPLGRFPVRKFKRPRRATQIQIQAQDRWQWVTADTFGASVVAYGGTAVRVAAQLIAEVDPYGWGEVLENTATSGIWTPAGTWSGTRDQAVGDLVEVAAAEAFIDRVGVPVVRDRPAAGDPVVAIRSGEGGTLIDLDEEIDWEKVVNAVVVSSSQTGSTLAPVTVAISDPSDPAHRSNISGGATSGGWQTMKLQSPAFTTQDEMLSAGFAALAKGAAPARTWSVQMPPDVSLDASDTVLLETRDGDVVAQIQSVTHPLTAAGQGQLSCVVAR